MSSRFVSVLLYIYLDSSHNKPGAKQSILGMKSTRPHWHPGSRIRIEFIELLNRSFCVIMYIFIFLVTHTYCSLSAHLVVSVHELVLADSLLAVAAPADVDCPHPGQYFPHLAAEDWGSGLTWNIILLFL